MEARLLVPTPRQMRDSTEAHADRDKQKERKTKPEEEREKKEKKKEGYQPVNESEGK